MIVPMLAQMNVKSTFNKYSKVRSTSGLTGKQVAEEILRENGIYDVTVERGQGNLTDHYDPRSKKVVLSPSNYDNRSEEHTSELQSRFDLVCRLLLRKTNAQKHCRDSN